MEFQRIMQHGLDGLRVFHTFFRHRITPLAERSWPMWQYAGPIDPDCPSSKELSGDEIWAYLGRVLLLGDQDSLTGTPGPLNATKLSNLVRSFPLIFFFLVLTSRSILSHLSRRGLHAINPGYIFREGGKA